MSKGLGAAGTLALVAALMADDPIVCAGLVSVAVVLAVACFLHAVHIERSP